MIRISPVLKHRRGGNGKIQFLIQTLRENYALVLLSLFLIAGILVGAVFAGKAGDSSLNRLDFLFSSNFKARAAQPLFTVFSASLASSFIFILFCFLCGLSMWGMFLVPAVVFFRGFGLGLTSGYIYACYAWKGVLYNFAVILPGAFFCCVALLLAAREGIRFSKRMAANGTSAQGGVIGLKNLKIYLMRFGTILALAFFAALIDLFFSVCFAGLFRF